MSKGCRSCTPLKETIGSGAKAHSKSLSHFPEEEEWLMPPYTAVEHVGQRYETLEIGADSRKSTVETLIVTCRVLDFDGEHLAPVAHTRP